MKGKKELKEDVCLEWFCELYRKAEKKETLNTEPKYLTAYNHFMTLQILQFKDMLLSRESTTKRKLVS